MVEAGPKERFNLSMMLQDLRGLSRLRVRVNKKVAKQKVNELREE